MDFSLAQEMDATGWLLTPECNRECTEKRIGHVTRSALPPDGSADSHMPSIFISLLGQPELEPSGVVMLYRVFFFSTRYSLGGS